MKNECNVKRWLSEIGKSQKVFRIRLDSEMVEIVERKSGKLIKAFVLDEVYTEDRRTLFDAVIPHLPMSRNWRYELKQKLNGMEKLTVWTHSGEADTLREVARAMLEYPVLTVATLRCIKTGHNVSLSSVDSNMRDRKAKGYYG